jgi:hypothetical protein
MFKPGTVVELTRDVEYGSPDNGRTLAAGTWLVIVDPFLTNAANGGYTILPDGATLPVLQSECRIVR